ncbi:MAG TPA: PfkB family carbohydrate kinase [Acidobacteriaceae bacterium]|jgi:sugar/nucleoside kinase (ribokinase family)|nr:PfkB family carbohydrate kinase [Acidobacteriaceae bacterium]
MTTGIFVGLSTIDLVYEVDQFPAGDSKITAKSQNVFVGGPAANAAIAFRHLGGDATLVTAVGRHPLAAIVREDLSRYKVALIDLTPGSEDVPAISSVAVDPAGRRNVISPNASRVSVPPVQVDPELLARASVLMVDGHAMQACQAWARAARHSGIRVVLDGGSWKEGMDTLLDFVDSALCSADFRVPNRLHRDQAIDFLNTHGVREIACTGGSGPIRWSTACGSGLIPVPQVPVVDTTGAGDILHGAFCWYTTQGPSFPESLRRAAAIASDSCRFQGTRAWMTTHSPPGGAANPAE